MRLAAVVASDLEARPAFVAFQVGVQIDNQAPARPAAFVMPPIVKPVAATGRALRSGGDRYLQFLHAAVPAPAQSGVTDRSLSPELRKSWLAGADIIRPR